MRKTHCRLQPIFFVVLGILLSSRAVKAYEYNLQGRNISSTEIMLTWNQPGPQDFPLYRRVSGYQIDFNRTLDYLEHLPVNNGSATGYILGALRPYTVYDISIRAVLLPGYHADSSSIITVRTQEAVPSKPGTPFPSGGDSDFVCVTFGIPMYRNGQMRYIIKWSHDNVAKTQKINFDPKDSYSSHACIYGLTPNTQYTLQVAAETNAGMGDYSKPLLVTTDVAVPGVPRNLTASIAGPKSIAISWVEPETYNPTIDGYTITVHNNWENKGSVTVDGNVTQYTFGDLEFAKTYDFAVKAFTYSKKRRNNRVGESVTTDFSLKKAFEAGTAEAYNVLAASLCLILHPPLNPDGPIQYIVKWSHGNVSKTKQVNPGPNYKDTSRTCIDGLTPATQYSVQMAVKTNAGMGKYSAPLLVVTDVAVPGVPRNLTASIAGPKSIVISWVEPETYNPTIDGYIVTYWSDFKGGKIVVVHENVTEYTFGDLDIKKTYHFQVKAITYSKQTYPADREGIYTHPVDFTLEMNNFQLRADPYEIKLLTTPNFSLNCSYEPEPILGVDYRFISLTLARLGYRRQELASIKAESTVQILDNKRTPDVVYSGEAHKEDKKAYYVSGKWNEVTKDLGGDYACTLKLMDKKGKVTSFNDQINVRTVFSPIDVRKELKKLKDQLEKEVAAQLSALADATLELTQSKSYENRNYIAVNHRIRDVEIADSICKIKGGYLVEVNDEQEWNFIKSFLASTKVDRAFIAGRRNDSKNEWFWPRRDQKLSYFDWYPNKPNHAAENCIETASLFEWQWNDIACRNDFDVFICEIPIV